MNFHCIYPFLWGCFAPAGLAITHEESSLLPAIISEEFSALLSMTKAKQLCEMLFFHLSCE